MNHGPSGSGGSLALQVEQLENQLRAKGGVAAKPSSGGTSASASDWSPDPQELYVPYGGDTMVVGPQENPQVNPQEDSGGFLVNQPDG